MGVLPKQEHFKLAMYASVFIGLWPVVLNENKLIYTFYKGFAKFIPLYFPFFVLSEIIQFFILLLVERASFEVVSDNLSITLIYFTSCLRYNVCRAPIVKNMITNVLKTENEILNSEDTGIVRIYKQNVRRNNLFSLFFISTAVCLDLFYVFWPLIDNTEIKQINNVTVEVKVLPVSSWLPFDIQKHYLQAYLLMLFNVNYMGSCFVISTEILTFGLITFPIGQIKILKHILRHYEIYKNNIAKKLNLSSDEASKTTIRVIVLKHKEIIRYIEEFNDQMKNLILMDFLQCSIQLTCLVYKILSQLKLSMIVINLQFLCLMLVRVLISYWNANEIIVQSEDIAREVFNINWLDESKEVKNELLIIMARAQRPLTLFIGAFSTMSLDTFFTILKATYSYISLSYSYQSK